jgi:hypothetical protein
MGRCEDVKVAARQSFWFKSWRERSATDWVLLVLIAAGGVGLGAILPRWGWNIFLVVVLVIGYAALWRRNRQRPKPPHNDWSPGSPPSSN